MEVWSFDEHRIGLLPLAGRVWATRGTRSARLVETRDQWLYLYGFVQPQTGRTFFKNLPCMNVGLMNAVLYTQALADFARAVGAGPHRSGEVVVPEGLHLLTLPPYSPELQPAERLWSLTNESLVNRHFETLETWKGFRRAGVGCWRR